MENKAVKPNECQLEKWLKNCDMSSSVIEKNKLKSLQLTWLNIHHQYSEKQYTKNDLQDFTFVNK